MFLLFFSQEPIMMFVYINIRGENNNILIFYIVYDIISNCLHYINMKHISDAFISS